jgi:hypothetical protein
MLHSSIFAGLPNHSFCPSVYCPNTVGPLGHIPWYSYATYCIIRRIQGFRQGIQQIGPPGEEDNRMAVLHELAGHTFTDAGTTAYYDKVHG